MAKIIAIANQKGGVERRQRPLIWRRVWLCWKKKSCWWMLIRREMQLRDWDMN